MRLVSISLKTNERVEKASSKVKRKRAKRGALGVEEKETSSSTLVGRKEGRRVDALSVELARFSKFVMDR